MFLYWLLRYGLVPLRIVHNLHPDGRIQRLDEAQGDGVGILISVGTDRYRRTTPGTFSNVLFKQLGIDIRYCVVALPVYPQIVDTSNRFRKQRRLVGILLPLGIV